MGDKDIHKLRVIKYREIILINSALCPFKPLESVWCGLFYSVCGASYRHNSKGTNGVSNWHVAFPPSY
jgi:hypothetical protein